MSEIDHLHIVKEQRFKALLLIIPAIAFVVVLAFYLKISSYQEKTTSSARVFATEPTPAPLKKLTVGNTEIMVEMADTNQKRAKGLSERAHLPEDNGMFFTFATDNVVPPFWMKDMLIPIDIVWIDDAKIIQIDHNAVPEPGVPDNQLKLYVPNQKIDYVLEVNAGFMKEHNIEVGAEVNLESLGL